MLQDVHTKKETLPVTATGPGPTVILSAVAEGWLYVHELMGDLDADGTLTIYAGARNLGEFDLVANQGITLSDMPGADGVPRFECRLGENFILDVTAGATFNGTIQYSIRY